MKRVITAVALLLIIIAGGITWLQAVTHRFKPMQQLAVEARESYAAGNTADALEKAKRLAEEYEHRTRFFDLFISHQTLFEAEKCVEDLPLILQYGDEKDFISETKRCELLIRRLWEQEIPRLDNIF